MIRRSKYTKGLAGVVLVLVVVGCSSGPSLTVHQQQGKRIYDTLCDKCHKPIDPKAHTDQEWIAATEKYGVPLKLRPEEIEAVKDYLTRANDSI